MSNNVFRVGGFAAIASAILYVVSLGTSFAGSGGNLGSILYNLSSLLLLVVLVILFLELRPHAAGTALIALIILGATTIWSLFIDPTRPSSAFGPLAIIYGAGWILSGWIQRSRNNILGLLALITGSLSVIAGIALLAGASFGIFGLFNLVLSVPFVIWLVWLGVSYLNTRLLASRLS